jgi:hypothetical protein
MRGKFGLGDYGVVESQSALAAFTGATRFP